MVASIVPFPLPHALLLAAAENGKAETPFAFAQRMCFEASRHIEESPSAAALFLEAAAQRLHREAIERSSPPNHREFDMSDQSPSSDPAVRLWQQWQELTQRIEAAPTDLEAESLSGEARDVSRLLGRTQATTLQGVVAKLRVLLDEMDMGPATDDRDIRLAETATADLERLISVHWSTAASPDLVALLDAEQAVRAEYDRREEIDSDKDFDPAWEAWQNAWLKVERFAPQSIADLALKAAAIARVYEDGDKEDVFKTLLADIERLAKG
jgi:hypothetical protein